MQKKSDMLGPEAESTHGLVAMMSAQNAEGLPARSLLGVLRGGGGWRMQTAEGGKNPVDQVRLKRIVRGYRQFSD